MRATTIAAALLLTAATTVSAAPVIVELFTSQGCSSCPPADRLLKRVIDDPATRGKVIPLAFHVDYWDRPEWRDPFSSKEWSRRQMFYARAFRLDSAYTPQMVVNGSRQFVGSNAPQLQQALREEANAAPFGTVAVAIANGQATVSANVTSGRPTDIFLAIVEREAATKIEGGENAGRASDDVAIVRRLIRVDTIAKGATRKSVALNLDKRWRGATAVVFLQDRATLAIRGASSVSIAP